MILAAGKGERMRPLTEKCPKPLLEVAGKPLIVYHLEKLALQGIKKVVINIAYLGEQIEQALGDGSSWGLAIDYSREPKPLETAGAIRHALPVLGEEPFILINADIWTDCSFEQFKSIKLKGAMAELLLVENPSHNLEGDFSIKGDLLEAKREGNPVYTYSGMGVYDPKIISDYPNQRQAFPLKEVLDAAIKKNKIKAQVYGGEWWDIGTPKRLAELNQQVSAIKPV